MSTKEEKFCSLDQLGKVSRGRSQHRPRNASHLYGGKYPFIQTAEITKSNLYITDYFQTYNETGLKQSRLWDKETLCIVNAGVNTGDNAILQFKACFPDSVIVYRANPAKCHVRFVKYFLDSIKTQIKSITMGATQDNLSVSKLLAFKLPKIKVANQKKIAAILSAYDDLIENNKRRIALLEKMAEEIYREWFVRFRFPGHDKVKFVKGVPEGWRVLRFSEKCRFDKGKNPTEMRESQLEGMLPYINVDFLENSTNKSYVTIQKNSVICEMGDVLMLMDGARSGVAFRSSEKGVVGSTFSIIRVEEILREYVFEYLKANIEAIVFNNTGSAIPHANKEFINRMIMVVPKDEVLLKKFNKFYRNIYSQKATLEKQNDILGLSKEKLLPRLISGKLSVENLDIHFPPSMLEGESEIQDTAYA